MHPRSSLLFPCHPPRTGPHHLLIAIAVHHPVLAVVAEAHIEAGDKVITVGGQGQVVTGIPTVPPLPRVSTPTSPYWIWESRPWVMTPVNMVMRRVSTSSQCARLSSSAHHAPSKKSSSLVPAWGAVSSGWGCPHGLRGGCWG